MGRNRKPRNAVSNASAAPVEEPKKYDILGRPIRPRVVPPVVTTTTPVVTPAPTTEATSSVAGQPDWFPYPNATYFNAAMIPPVLQTMVKGGGQAVYDEVMGAGEYNRQRTLEKFRQEYGLDLSNPKDCQIWADFMSIFKPANNVSASRSTDVRGDTIKLYNSSFYANGSPEGTGYVMVARQVAAAQEIAKRTGKPVVIRVHAAQGGVYNGVATWPKLGYEFDIPYSWQRELVSRYGFKQEDVENGTQKFMDKRNRTGTQGWDVWRDLVESMPLQSLYGTTTVYPDGRETPAIAVTRGYGKRRGYNKALRQATDTFFSRQGPSAEDDAALKEAWMEMRRKAK